MKKKFPQDAVIILDKKILFPEILKYLYKFNIKKIIILNFTNLKLNLSDIKKYEFAFNIYNFKKKKFQYSVLFLKKILKKLNNNFFIFKASKFINLNLFDLFKKFNQSSNKLILNVVNIKKRIKNTEIYILNKNQLKKYNFSFDELENNKDYILNFSKEKFLELSNKKIDGKTIYNFFSNIYSKVILLDRDGVINKDKGYVGFKNQFIFQRGAVKAIKYLNEKGYNIFVVSNQSGIARGYFTDKDVKYLHNFLRDQLMRKYCFINKIYYSPFHKNGVIKQYTKNSQCRKPGIKLFNELTREWKIKKRKTILMIGDQITDMQFAQNAKIKGALFKSQNLYEFIKKLSI